MILKDILCLLFGNVVPYTFILHPFSKITIDFDKCNDFPRNSLLKSSLFSKVGLPNLDNGLQLT